MVRLDTMLEEKVTTLLKLIKWLRKNTSGWNFKRRVWMSSSGKKPRGRTIVNGPASPLPHRLVTNVYECLDPQMLSARASLPAVVAQTDYSLD